MAIPKAYLEPLGVMPVVVIDRVEDAVPLANALKAGGIKAIEVTLRTDAAVEALRMIKAECSGIEVGVGTVVSINQLHTVAELGVDFAVSPGYTPSLVDAANELNVQLLPGVSTLSEVMMGMEQGLSCFKLFPAAAVGGLALLKSFAGPLPQISFCPTGGLTFESFSDYLALPNVACVGGTWLAPKALVDAGDWAAITEIARATVAKISN
ncbi:bifunctional 4-hydroxy-2-oxoglutarate aldolase/2-dehydro-3-deoxy-phosphogluconate aldolase [Teredinibacter waterburyi]|jgi:2-keto-3-deoxy-phosphogluconate aldolase (EC 4.1.2.14)|uniref:bifunctional 4-hydroxy-2-oxoglutarate aldolase/2-dehydro-3-deoxy-phosphogluconate aldolase n=1 Tax=Teredinibacter waterburyi TaxID=1500538 RepID=UPI00165F99B9|nr:bifunctional 4-hydroxy-2-oxoglutarate aldolase/2-dehydro-3-deoxy-phosphogluconate aldolase [Teredinibacter waterburyi]